MNWKDTFKNEFGNYGLYEDVGYMGRKDVLDKVETFIENLLQEQRDEMIKVVEKLYMFRCTASLYRDCDACETPNRDDLLEALKKNV